jgi:hypothetical protein
MNFGPVVPPGFKITFPFTKYTVMGWFEVSLGYASLPVHPALKVLDPE